MKKLWRSIGALLCASVLLTSFVGCGDGDDDDDGGDTNRYSFANISVGRAYIGGSLIYNPGGNYSHLSAGTVVAVREGRLKVKGTETVDVYNEDTTTQTENPTPTGTDTITVYEDDAEKARFGYITISSIDSSAVSFVHTRYAIDGTSSVNTSYKVEAGKSVDINGDSIPDVSYAAPALKRSGFENAMWLTFECTEDTTTTMYSTFSQDAARVAVRAADDATIETTDIGLYGINSNGNFIYMVNSSNDAVNSSEAAIGAYSAAYGDFVIVLDGDNAENSDDASDSYTVVANDDGTKLIPAQELTAFEYSYKAIQFPHDDGPALLLKALPASLVGADIPTAKADGVSRLNAILADRSAAKILLEANGESVASETEAEISSCTDAQYVRAVRRIIDECYPASPNAEAARADINAMFPYMAMNLSDTIHTYDESANDSDASESVALINDMASARAASYDSYKAEYKSIKNDFSNYFSIKLTKFKDTKVLDGITVAIGVKGTASVTGSRAELGLTAAIYLDLDLNLTQDTIDSITKALQEKIPEDKKPKFEKTFMVGPVPLTIGGELSFGIDFKVTTDGNKKALDLYAGYVGMYGAGVTAGANYGWKKRGRWIKIKIPYINFFADPYLVNRTSYYFGPKTANIGASFPIKNGIGIKTKIEPSVPSVSTEEVSYQLTITAKCNLKIKVLVFSFKKDLLKKELVNKKVVLYKK